MSALILLFGAGCGGLRASHSVSPLDFLLPGFGQTESTNSPDKTPPPLQKPARHIDVLAQAD